MGCGTCDSYGICTNQCQSGQLNLVPSSKLSNPQPNVIPPSLEKTVSKQTSFKVVTILFHGQVKYSVIDQDGDLVGITHRERHLVQSKRNTCDHLEFHGLPMGDKYKAFKALQLEDGHFALKTASQVERELAKRTKPLESSVRQRELEPSFTSIQLSNS